MPGPLDNKGEELTIAVGVACPEGLVLAADSRATVIGEGYARVATDYSHKVFDIGGRFGAATFGWRFLEANTIEGVMEEFAAQTKLPKAVDELVERLKDYFGARIKKHLEAGIDQEPPEGPTSSASSLAATTRRGSVTSRPSTFRRATSWPLPRPPRTTAEHSGRVNPTFSLACFGGSTRCGSTPRAGRKSSRKLSTPSRIPSRSFACRCKMRSISPLSLSGRRSTRSGSPMERLGRRAASPPAAGPSRCWL